jgi:O-antigen/teichoic acid export membrane protein
MCTSTFYIGSLIGAIGCVFIWFALRYFYLFDLPWYDFVLAAMAVVFGFTFAPVVFYLFGLNRQWNVIGIDVICFLVNAIISFALIPHMGITGALLAVAASQLLMALLYLYKVR